jgi:hypothetical protein
MNGATLNWQPKPRAEVLAIKREVTLARLRYAESVGDKTLIAAQHTQLERIARWESEATDVA